MATNSVASNHNNVTRILITGGCGFIGHHVAEHFFRKTNWEIIIIDKLNYASHGFSRFRDNELLFSPRVTILTWDLVTPISNGLMREIGDVDYVVHMAAETHIDKSIEDPVPFVRNNIDSTLHILEFARSQFSTLKKFFYFSTDEVYGSAPDGVSYKELDRHNPTNPYSASKSASENISLAYQNTYKVPIIVVNIMNAFGERQHTEKFIPKLIKMIRDDQEVKIHAYPDLVRPGSRFYIHARNIADGIMFLINNGVVGENYNISGEREVDNLELAQLVAKFQCKDLRYKLVDFHTARPGHDSRYSLDDTKIRTMGWNPPLGFEQSLQKVVEWSLLHPKWLDCWDEE